MQTLPVLSGQGGKKSPANSDTNSLRSKARVHLVYAVSEGPVEGLIAGSRSIYVNESPIENSDGSINHENVQWWFRKGDADGAVVRGATGVEAYFTVNEEVKKAQPVMVTITESGADAVKVIARIDSLFKIDKKGAMKATNVTYGFDIRPSGGSWTRAVTNEIVDEKTTSPMQIMHRLDLPENGAPWDVRMVRVTEDSTEEKLVNGISFDAYSVVTDGRFTYPHTATLAIEFNAEDAGNSTPEVTMALKGRKVRVPTNYDPITRTYDGIWDGTFKWAWTNCPPWIYYDMIANNTFGVGDYVKLSTVDKWALYTIARHCDQRVPTGYKNEQGADIMEPRYTFNGVINDKREAFFALQSMTKAWRGMSYWSRGQVVCTADMPSDPVRVFAPANVVGGRFEYSSTSIKARSSVVLVRYNDPESHFSPATEAVIDQDMVERFGWREKTLTLEGCTSRSLAHRYGKWVIDTEKNETETVTFTAAWDTINAVPGEIIAIADPRRAQVRMGGRIVSHTEGQIVLDGDFVAASGASYTISVQMPSGSIQSLPVTSVAEDKRTLTVGTSATLARADAVFVITGTDVEPRTYRIVSLDETDSGLFTVTALQHDPNKYARVEYNIKLKPRNYMRRKKLARAPANLRAEETVYTVAGKSRSDVILAWDGQVRNVVREYIVTVDTPSKRNVLVGRTNTTSIEYTTEEEGRHVFKVVAVPFAGKQSAVSRLVFVVQGDQALILHRVENLVNDDTDVGGTTEFYGRTADITWKNKFPKTTRASTAAEEGDDEDNPRYSHNIVRVYAGASSTLMRQAKVVGRKFSYTREMNRRDSAKHGFAAIRRTLRFEVIAVDTIGRESPAAVLTMTNPAPLAPTPTFLIDGRRLRVRMSRSEDEDVDGYVVWIEKNNTFNPLTTTPKYDGDANVFTFTGDPRATDYFVRVAAYDAYGKDGMVISPVYSVRTEREQLGDGTFVNIDGNEILISDIAANSIVPSLNYVGEYASHPTQAQLGSAWRQNAVYKNTTNGRSYVLTGSPLAWVKYIEDGNSFTLSIESSNGTTFRIGGSQSTTLMARVFKNGAEVTNETPAEWFRWRRKSAIPRPAPNDDASWNSLYQSGYKEIMIDVDQVQARATFFCDIIST